MITQRNHKYIILSLAVLSVLAFSCNCVQANDRKVSSLLQCLSTAQKTPAKGEGIAVSVIKQDNFDAEKLIAIDLSHVGCGPLSQENIFHLTCGNALFNPKKDIVVLTALAKISVASGSAVCVLKPEAGVISVYNLHSGNGKKVSVEIGGQAFVLSPGVHVTICYEGSDFATINPARRIAYRNLHAKDLPHGIRLYSTEFSIPSAIAHITPLQTMLSSNNKDEQKLAEQLLKNSVILDYVCDSDQPYTVAAEPQPRQLSAANTYIEPAEHLLQTSLVQ